MLTSPIWLVLIGFVLGFGERMNVGVLAGGAGNHILVVLQSRC